MLSIKLTTHLEDYFVSESNEWNDADFLVASFGNFPVEDDSMDMIFIKNVLHHVDDPGKLLEKLREVNKRGSIVGAENNRTSPFIQFSGRILKHERRMLKSNKIYLKNLLISAGFGDVHINLDFFPIFISYSN